MDSSAADSFVLRSTSAVSLNERFSQVQVDQLTQSRMVTFDPVLLQQRVSDSLPVVLLVKTETTSPLSLQKQHLRRKRSVWTRLGGQQLTRRLSAFRPRGFWSFRNRFRWRARFSSAYSRWRDLRSRLGQRRLLMRRKIQKQTAGPAKLRLHLPRGGATAARGRGLSKAHVPTRKQLDAQLDEYMSLSRSRLDQQLDEYMATSRSRLDAELDEYMAMAGAKEGGGAGPSLGGESWTGTQSGGGGWTESGGESWTGTQSGGGGWTESGGGELDWDSVWGGGVD